MHPLLQNHEFAWVIQNTSNKRTTLMHRPAHFRLQVFSSKFSIKIKKLFKTPSPPMRIPKYILSTYVCSPFYIRRELTKTGRQKSNCSSIADFLFNLFNNSWCYSQAGKCSSAMKWLNVINLISVNILSAIRVRGTSREKREYITQFTLTLTLTTQAHT